MKQLKIILACLTIMALLVIGAGCAGCPRTNATTGVTTKTPMNCVKNVVDTSQKMVCNPPQDVLTVVQSALSILAVINSPAAIYAATVAQMIQTIGCTDLTALQKFIDELQSPEFTKAQQSQTKAWAMASRTIAPIDVSPLVDWSRTAK